MTGRNRPAPAPSSSTPQPDAERGSGPARVPTEGSATPPEQPATPPEQPATPPSDGEKSPDERVALSRSTTGDQSDPAKPLEFATTDGDADGDNERDPLPEQVKRFQLEQPKRFRAAGHVLTDRGWEIDPGAEQPGARSVGEPEQVEQSEQTVQAETARQARLAKNNERKG